MSSYTIATMENKSDSFSVFFSFTNTDDSQNSRGREWTIFYSTLSLPLAHKHRHLFATLHVRWLSCIFNRNACGYQNYHLIEWLMIQCLFTWLIDSRFLLQGFNMRNRWICICISPFQAKLQANWQTKWPSHPKLKLGLKWKTINELITIKYSMEAFGNMSKLQFGVTSTLGLSVCL